VIVVGQVDLEDSILPADHIAAAAAAVGNVDLVVGVGNPVRDILQVVVVAVVGVLLFGVEAYRSQDEVVAVEVDHRTGIVEEDIVDDFANLVVAGEAAAAAEEEVVAVVVAAAGEEVVEQLEVAAVAVPEVAAYDTAVAAAAAAVKEEVLAD